GAISSMGTRTARTAGPFRIVWKASAMYRSATRAPTTGCGRLGESDRRYTPEPISPCATGSLRCSGGDEPVSLVSEVSENPLCPNFLFFEFVYPLFDLKQTGVGFGHMEKPLTSLPTLPSRLARRRRRVGAARHDEMATPSKPAQKTARAVEGPRAGAAGNQARVHGERRRGAELGRDL